jgi:RNA polymerase sigma-54 factor
MLGQIQNTSLRPLTTAHLAQTMTLLSLTALELRQRIESELSTNPALELIDDRYCPTCHRPLANSGPCPICSQPNGKESEEAIVFVSPREDFIFSHASYESTDNAFDEYTPQLEDLPTYVMHQIAPELAPEDRLLAIHVLTGLDDDGLLQLPLAEIANYHHVSLARLEKVVNLIQHADPVGVASSTPQEALLIQLETLAETTSVPPLAKLTIQKGLDALSRHQYHELAHLLGTSAAKAREIAQFISQNLNPFPARCFWGENQHTSPKAEEVFFNPDIVISTPNNSEDLPFVIEVISPLAGKLRINPLFKDAIHHAPSQKAEQWHADYEKASLLVKCIQQRNHTMVRLMQSIAHIQKSFICNGDAHLHPLTRASLAAELGVHESTISRAVSSKTAQLPNGRIIPLSKFFDRSLHIRTELINIISNETEPLTDTQIAVILKKRGYKVARRTVAKYRAIEGIMPAHLRGKFHKDNKPKPNLLMQAA